MNANEVKKAAMELGADLCGIASVDRFEGAPEGFHPRDVLPECKSVIVLAKSFLAGTLKSPQTIPYTIVRNVLSDRLDKMSVELCEVMERQGIVTIPTGTIGPTELDGRTGRLRNIISAKHAAVAAGLGVLGKNSLLITPEYGNMVWLTALLTEVELEADQVMENEYCTSDCYLCIDVCKAHAIPTNTNEILQNNCCEYAFGEENGGEWRIKCYQCRTVCPYCLGSRNQSMK